MTKNELTRRLYKMRVGTRFNIRGRDGSYAGTFLRVPTGWVFIYKDRATPSSCFIPYTETIQYHDIDMPMKRCFSCNSSNVSLSSDYFDSNWYGECSECGSCSAKCLNKDKALDEWNKIKR